MREAEKDTEKRKDSVPVSEISHSDDQKPKLILPLIKNPCKEGIPIQNKNME